MGEALLRRKGGCCGRWHHIGEGWRCATHRMNDVASAFGSINQSFSFNGLCGTKGHWSGSRNCDRKDQGDGNSISCANPPQSED